MEGWRASMYFDDDRPAVGAAVAEHPDARHGVVYPGTVLFEGTNVSEGRGTTRPFELIGAPWVVAERFAGGDEPRWRCPACSSGRRVFEPTFHKHAKTAAAAARFTSLDRRAFRPVETGVALIARIPRRGSRRFALARPPYEYEHEKLPIDILAGSSETARADRSGQPARDIARSWEPAWRVQRAAGTFLLYPAGTRTAKVTETLKTMKAVPLLRGRSRSSRPSCLRVTLLPPRRAQRGSASACLCAWSRRSPASARRCSGRARCACRRAAIARRVMPIEDLCRRAPGRLERFERRINRTVVVETPRELVLVVAEDAGAWSTTSRRGAGRPRSSRCRAR